MTIKLKDNGVEITAEIDGDGRIRLSGTAFVSGGLVLSMDNVLNLAFFALVGSRLKPQDSRLDFHRAVSSMMITDDGGWGRLAARVRHPFAK